jgi:hypothetical protein
MPLNGCEAGNGSSGGPAVRRSRDAEYCEYVAARLSSLRRLAAVLGDDWQRADDLVQVTFHQILFDLQRGDKAVKAELHDSEFSGVIVCLHH